MKKIICALIFCFLFPVFVLGGTFEENVHKSQKKAMEWFVRQYILSLFDIKFEADGTEGKFVQDEMITRMTSQNVYNRNLVTFKYDMGKGGGSLQAHIDTLKTLNDDNFGWEALVMLKEMTSNSTRIIPLQVRLQAKCSPLGSEFKEDNPFGCTVISFDWQERGDILVSDSVKDKFNSTENWESLKPKDCGSYAFYSLPVLVCAFCSDNEPIPSTSDECDKCPNRKMRGKFCVLNDESPKKTEAKVLHEIVSDTSKKREVKIQNRVVFNDDAKGALPVCGSVSSSQPCLFYILNITNHDIVAEDFFDQAAHAMNRRIRSIRSENPLYQKQVIKPGYFAEIIIPALK